MAVVAEDAAWENLLDYFDVCLDFIDAARKEGGVLVHCYAGQSRRSTVPAQEIPSKLLRFCVSAYDGYLASAFSRYDPI
ncbi:unnamed protein product [Cochlearia groenlandica]